MAVLLIVCALFLQNFCSVLVESSELAAEGATAIIHHAEVYGRFRQPLNLFPRFSFWNRFLAADLVVEAHSSQQSVESAGRAHHTETQAYTPQRGLGCGCSVACTDAVV